MSNYFFSIFTAFLIRFVAQFLLGLKRIVNGTLVAQGKRKFQVALFWRGETRYDRCGGILISKYLVLTAAHCVGYDTFFELEVLAGSVDLNNEQRVQIRKITNDKNRIIIHENYRDNAADILENGGLYLSCNAYIV